jgi:spore maturation protein CgeB
MAAYDLGGYDGVLAFGEVVRQRYLEAAWADRAWTWHEAADVRVFRPLPAPAREGELVWIGNWGDEERSAELEEFVIEPAERLGLRARVHGVRYPRPALERLARARIVFGGWLPNYAVPEVFARFAATVHVPRRPYVRAMPGIPTIRVFEALACGIPLISAPWEDSEGLFHAGADYLVARNGTEMRRLLSELLADERAARAMAAHGLETVLARHTCAHRVDELLAIVGSLDAPARAPATTRSA